MESKLSQPTLGLLRKLLDGMQPGDIITPNGRRTFWKNELFDFGFPPAVIDVAITYQFRWDDIIPDLFLGKFGRQNENFSSALPQYVCEQTLNRLFALALDRSRGTAAASKFRESLGRDGFDLKSGVESAVPAEVDASTPSELAQIPIKPLLLSDLTRRLDAHELIAVVFADLDGFKQVNDTLGHDEGDNCLKRIVEIIGAVIAGKGRLYRPGGDEFVVVFPNFSRHEAAATAERIRAAIDKENPGGEIKVTASIGVTDSGSEAATDATALFKIADAAMYMAKEKKNCVVVDHGINSTTVRMPKPTSTAVYGETDDLYIGSRVHVLEPVPGVPREKWTPSSLLWVIREINSGKKTAKATPVLPPLNGPTPTVEGPMSGPESPFIRTNIPS
ncbi:MAG TPA: GGDEF domain-containing protein [Terriglobales bacterium]|jgi:diguanylate cyclase (GGDEF)-like protein|nr:GGDEF domain-containing protein [Terriglobales bacterium]